MAKILTIQGCSTCPHARKFDEDIENRYWCLDQQDLDLGENLPKTPHPDCKLPDLPTSEEINIDVAFAEVYNRADENREKSRSFRAFEKGLNYGANYIINKIK